jgi:ribosome modulation factor
MSIDRMAMGRCTEILPDDPVCDTVHQPFAAFNQGCDAFHWGLKRDVNPYPPSEERRWWESGWNTARDEIKF